MVRPSHKSAMQREYAKLVYLFVFPIAVAYYVSLDSTQEWMAKQVRFSEPIF